MLSRYTSSCSNRSWPPDRAKSRCTAVGNMEKGKEILGEGGVQTQRGIGTGTRGSVHRDARGRQGKDFGATRCAIFRDVQKTKTRTRMFPRLGYN